MSVNSNNAQRNALNVDEEHEILRNESLTEDTTCGIWILRGSFLQRFANQTAYGIVFGVVGLLFAMVYAYFNGIITTLEKRFKIPSQNIGIISMGKDVSQFLLAGVLCYYAGRRHQPRWIGFGLFAIVGFCVLCVMLHFIYGPGQEALDLTVEYGGNAIDNSTKDFQELCRLDGSGSHCDASDSEITPQIVLFLAKFISGIGGALYYTLGISYMDDNTDKTKTPIMLSISIFLGLLGPAIGYALASFCLRFYIAPYLTPVITMTDTRWLGAWWMGWFILAFIFSAAGIIYAMFPKRLPKKLKKKNSTTGCGLEGENNIQLSFADMMHTFKRLLTNKPYMFNNLGRIFYFIGYTPFLMFTPKYIEIQFKQSASTSSLVTGLVPLVSTAFGVLISGFIISKFKPRARVMAAWNLLVCLLTVGGIISYAFIGCPDSERSVVVNIPDAHNITPTCNSDCHCDFVRYAPVCGENNLTYISPCHAGCKQEYVNANGTKIYYDCSCINSNQVSSETNTGFVRLTIETLKSEPEDIDKDSYSFWHASNDKDSFDYANLLKAGQATPGACPVDCFAPFVTFLAVMSFLNFMGSTGHAANVLISVRSVTQRDKSTAMGLGMMLICLLTFIPSPIFFGWLLDSMCLVWGKTCTRKGNCWFYDSESLRHTLNATAAAFIIIGALFDCGLWYYVKDLKIFDEHVKDSKEIHSSSVAIVEQIESPAEEEKRL